MNQRTTDGADLAAITGGQRISCLVAPPPHPPPPPPIGFSAVDHRQFDSAWNMFGVAEDFDRDLGFMDADSDFGIFGSFPNQQTYFDLQMNDGLNDFPLLNVGEIANHDPMPVRSSFCAQSSSLHEMSPSSTEIRSMVPSSSPYSGDFGFQVAVAEQLKTTKSASWVFFERINKLFVMKDKPCPFMFKTSRSPPPGSFIRVLPIYPTADHVTEIVTRCPTHACERKSQEEDPSLSQHLILSEHRSAEHVQDAYSNRLNVIIPYEDPQVGAEWVTSLFQFKCLGSCQKINDRRSWQVLFTLESPRGVVLGRQVVLVHCCSSPGRDGLREEQKRFGAVAAPPAAAAAAAKKNLVTTAMLRNSVSSVLPKFNGGADSDGVYALRIRGRERFELLLKIRDSLQMSASVDQSTFDKFRQKLRQMDALVKQEEPGQRGRGAATNKTPIGRDRPNGASKKVKKKRFESGASEHDSGCRDNEASFRHQPFNI